MAQTFAQLVKGISAVSAPANSLNIDSSGRVGIGTASPSAPLTFAGSVGRKIGLYQSTEGYSIGVESSEFRFVTDSGGAFTFRNGATYSSATEYARIDSSGRLLVGTSSGTGTTSLLVVNGNTSGSLQQAEILLNNGADIAGEYGLGAIYFGGESNYQIGASISAVSESAWNTGGDTTDSPARLVFSTTADGASSPTERMRITSGGQAQLVGDGLLIGSTFASGTSAIILQGYHSATAGSQGSGTVSFRIYNNGNVQNTNNSYGAISDVKLKENIVDATSQWNDIKALQVRKYNLKEGQTHTQIGLIAQEVELVSPGLVTDSPDFDEEGNDLGTVTKSVNYSVLYMKAVKALQEAMERIEQLETEMAALKAQLS
jgi:hypothetical protein